MRLPYRRAVRLLVLLAVGMIGTALIGLATPAAAAEPVRVEEQRLDGAGVALDTSLYLPATTPAPAVLVAHGFGGTKASVDADARDLAARGFVVLTWTARGFGASGGQIALDAPDAEVADARKLVDWLATRPEVLQDGPGDPRVGVTGGSYGGALSLMLAGYDQRVDAIAPVITWNDLAQALLPQRRRPRSRSRPTRPRPRRLCAERRVQARAGRAFLRLRPLRADPPPGTVLDLRPVHPGRLRRLHRGRDHRADLARHRGAARPLLPASVTDRITAPTLLVQGEQDTLFGLDQADANARQIAAHGTPVKVAWYAGGHDGGRPRPGRARPDRRLVRPLARGRGDGDPTSAFSYAVQSGVRAGPNTPTGRTVVAPDYPGLAAAPRRPGRTSRCPATRRSSSARRAATPPRSRRCPASVARSARSAGRLTAISARSPARPRSSRRAPVAAPLTVAGAPRVQLTVARVPGQPAPAEAVLFVGTAEVAQDGTRTLLGSSVAPLRVAVPADGSATVTVTLPGVVAPVEAGHTPRRHGRDHRPGLRGRHRPGRVAGRRRPAGCPCRWCPARRARPTPCRPCPRSASA